MSFNSHTRLLPSLHLSVRVTQRLAMLKDVLFLSSTLLKCMRSHMPVARFPPQK